MIIKNWKIKLQLLAGLSILLLFVIILGFVSYLQTNKIHRQTELMYEHPLQVRRAVGMLRADVYMIHWGMESAFRQSDYSRMRPFIKEIKKHDTSAEKNFDILFNHYLGPREDIEKLHRAYIACRSNREEVLGLIQNGTYEKANQINIHENDLIGSDHLNELVSMLEKISDFSEIKADNLLNESHELNNRLNYQLMGLIAIILAFSLLVNYTLIYHIRTPLRALTNAASQFAGGNLSARSNYASANEFGTLSETFNSLAANLQNNLEINHQWNHLARLMLSEDDPRRFFQNLLKALLEATNSQMAAIYLIDDKENDYHLYESIGLGNEARASFSATEKEGEFGRALVSGKIEYLSGLTGETRYLLNAVSGKIVPEAIITIPIVASNDTVAFISLASVNPYTTFVHKLLDTVHPLLSARVAGIMLFKKVNEFSQRLETQNHELEAQKGTLSALVQELEIQKSELEGQSNELIAQNSELENQKKQLNEANRLKTNFLSNMSHELRTPLNSVIALSGVLNRRLAEKIPEEEYSYIGVIERNGKHLLALINDILDISRIEAGREEIELTDFNICVQLNNVIDMIRPQSDIKNIILDKPKGDCDISIRSDTGKFHQIMVNLIGNAVKFTETGQIKVRVERSDTNVKIKVSDTGIGISEAHLPHIFDEFRQADGSTSRKYGGTGLGLAIARKYARLLGGDIEAISTPGQGSVFTLTLPLITSADTKSPENATTAASRFSRISPSVKEVTANENPKILLVEDSEPVAIQMKDLLDSQGIELRVAPNGATAIQMIEEEIPDALILDLMMPGMDGFEVLEKIRASEPTRKLPVIILTAKHITPEEKEVLKSNNVYQLIQKGDINRDELLKAVRSMTPAKSAPKTAVKPKKAVPVKGRPLILVVEDNPDNLLTVKALLASDYDLIEATDGRQAVSIAASHHPHLILMDIALPGMDGITAFQTIRSNPKLCDIPIIALTASAMTSDRETILAHGFDAYIAKPIDESNFFKTMKAVLYGT